MKKTHGKLGTGFFIFYFFFFCDLKLWIVKDSIIWTWLDGLEYDDIGSLHSGRLRYIQCYGYLRILTFVLSNRICSFGDAPLFLPHDGVIVDGVQCGRGLGACSWEGLGYRTANILTD